MQTNFQLVGVGMDIEKIGQVNALSYILPLVQYHVTLMLTRGHDTHRTWKHQPHRGAGNAHSH